MKYYNRKDEYGRTYRTPGTRHTDPPQMIDAMGFLRFFGAVILGSACVYGFIYLIFRWFGGVL